MKPRYKSLIMLIRMSNIQKNMFKSNKIDKKLKAYTHRLLLPETTQKRKETNRPEN